MPDNWPTNAEFAAMPIEAVVELALVCLSETVDDPPGTGADLWLIKRPLEILMPLASALADDARSERRLLAAHILGQASWHWPAHKEAATLRLRQMLASEADEDVLRQAAIAVGLWRDEAALSDLVRLKTHDSCVVRFGVAYGLSGVELEAAKRHLIDLTRDEDEDVRDWAVFGLGQQTELDFPDLREALVAALDDPVAMVRAEAIEGLAVRGDRRAVVPLKRELAAVPTDEEWPLLWQCAEMLSASELVFELQAQLERYEGIRPPDDLVAALNACRAASGV
jgi:HEAT repeat protein